MSRFAAVLRLGTNFKLNVIRDRSLHSFQAVQRSFRDVQHFKLNVVHGLRPRGELSVSLSLVLLPKGM